MSHVLWLRRVTRRCLGMVCAAILPEKRYAKDMGIGIAPAGLEGMMRMSGGVQN